jgi:transglutaminase-like putative cysteine protease
MTVLVRPRDESRYHRLVDERRVVEPQVPVHDFSDGFGNQVWRLVAPAGRLRLVCDALAEVPPTPDPVLPGLPKTPVADLPDDTLVYTLASRYCQIDLFIGDAWKMFGSITSGWEQVQAICDWLKGNVVYGAGSTASTSSFEAYQARCGVCRDFAHLGVAFCRALNIPARYVSGYLPDIGVPPDPVPMDFHAWFEAYLDGDWRTFDARHNVPRTGRVLIAYGRDAVDAAFTTSYGGARLGNMKVWADEVDYSFSLGEGPATPAEGGQ